MGLSVVTEPIAVTAGSRRVSVAFLKEFEGVVDDYINPVEHTLADTQIGLGYGVTTVPHLRNVAITGPFNVRGVSDNPTRRAVLTCRPATASEELPCARRILERVAATAYRRPVSAADVDELLRFYTQGATQGNPGGFDAGMRTALQAMLSSLHFLFRLEEAPAAGTSGGVYRVTDVDLASRLSFFLLGHDSRPDADRSCQPRTAVPARGLRPAGEAHARRPPVGSVGDAIRLAVDASAGPRQGGTRRAGLSIL